MWELTPAFNIFDIVLLILPNKECVEFISSFYILLYSIYKEI